MNAEPELYPPEALSDEEPRYLRRQKPVEIRRRKFSRGAWPAYRRWMLVGAGVLAGGFLIVQGFRFFLFSPRVQLAGYDQIEIAGNHYATREAIAEKFAPDLGKSILRVPLDARRAAMETIPWVAEANVERALPNRLRVEISERTPVAFLRLGNDLALVDASGVILDRPLDGDLRFPVASGLSEAMPLPDREKRMGLFVEFLKEINLANASAGDGVSEVDLSDAQDVRATLAGLPGIEGQAPVVVHFGDTDFGGRYRLLLDNIAQWRASAGQLDSVDLRFSGQVVVNPESNTVAKASPASPPGKAKR